MLLTALALTIAVPQQCRAFDTRLPAPLAGWTRNGRDFDTGHAVTLNAGRDGIAATTVRIRKAGTFGIALDQPGWIDVAPMRGKPLESRAHGHGPECSTIRKIVRYQLRPGTYRVTVNKLKGTRARLMLVRY
ncbi:hypothetical protein FHS95_004113 [Sphingomonas naasensis]|uniref:Homogentisate 1,2-dioxygenase n=1 Tax=Sphingomonas naasensis TaxID=1344951 RepID=A0A4S1WGD8_9SPHN|nr:hypothetical protein [Sphingomonas naasensis]NIJ22398.1 hypothetical protein [Sphingomonas naasensis]TGX40610.1 hypothetical protein E5A74_13960 [Sphingomonas naasensis]